LYRAIPHPVVEDGVLFFNGVPCAELVAAADMCKALGSAYGKFDHYEYSTEKLEFEFRLPKNEHGRFFDTVDDLIRSSSSISKGVFPKNIFIIDQGWSDSDSKDTSAIAALRRICRLVELLSVLAVGVDRESNPDCYNLFFALPPDGSKPPRSFLLPTLVDSKVLIYEIQHLNLLEEILNKKNENKAHLSERKIMLRLAIADVVERFEHESNLLLALVREWRVVLSQYRTNLQTYVYGFSFEKARREVAQAEIDYGSKLSAVLGDIAGKLLALPVSLAALIPLNAAKSIFESGVIFIGLLLVTAVLFAILLNQRLQVDRLLHSFNVVFDEFRGKISTYPPKLQRLLKITISQVERQGEVLTRTFVFLQVVSFAPVFFGVLVLIAKYWASLSELTFRVINLFIGSGMDPLLHGP